MRSQMAIAAYRALMPRLPQSRLRDTLELLRRQGVRSEVIENLQRFDHHDAHLASAYYSSGEPDCLVVSNDAFGDGLCCKVGFGRAGDLAMAVFEAWSINLD